VYDMSHTEGVEHSSMEGERNEAALGAHSKEDVKDRSEDDVTAE